MKPVVFHLMFDIKETKGLAELYSKDWDKGALAAGENIRNGNYSRSNLATIIGWKSERRAKLLADNSDSDR
jgi:hypothetical protein